MFIVLINGCSKSDIESQNNDSYLSKVEFYFENNEDPWRTIKNLVDENDKITGISDSSEVSILIYKINLETFNIEEKYKFYPEPNITEWTKIYDIAHNDNNFLVTETVSGDHMIFSTSNNYVDEYKYYINNQINPYHRTVFKRNDSNQIETIESFTTEGQNTGVEIPLWKLSFSNYSLDNNFPSFSNPVFGAGLYNFYNFSISELLGLKISNNPPLSSEVSIDSNNVNNVNIQIMTTTNNNMPEILNYNYGNSASEYNIRFSY